MKSDSAMERNMNITEDKKMGVQDHQGSEESCPCRCEYCRAVRAILAVLELEMSPLEAQVVFEATLCPERLAASGEPDLAHAGEVTGFSRAQVAEAMAGARHALRRTLDTDLQFVLEYVVGRFMALVEENPESYDSSPQLDWDGAGVPEAC